MTPANTNTGPAHGTAGSAGRVSSPGPSRATDTTGRHGVHYLQQWQRDQIARANTGDIDTTPPTDAEYRAARWHLSWAASLTLVALATWLAAEWAYDRMTEIVAEKVMEEMR